MSHLPLEVQLRRYGDDLERQQQGEAFNQPPHDDRASRANRSILLAIVALFVLAVGAAALTMINHSPDHSPADQPPAVLDQQTIAAYIAQSSKMLGGIQVGDPCPDQWPSVSAPLSMEPTSVSPKAPGCTILSWTPGSVTALPEDAQYLQDGSILPNSAGPATTAPPP
jgi:hypothetical protein